MTDTIVYKILDAADWRSAAASGSYTGSADDARDGFVHLSTAGQLAGTAAKWFRGRADLVLVALDVGRLGAALRWEPSRGGALFPHLYGALDVAAAISVQPMTLDAEGIPVVPPEVPTWIKGGVT